MTKTEQYNDPWFKDAPTTYHIDKTKINKTNIDKTEKDIPWWLPREPSAEEHAAAQKEAAERDAAEAAEAAKNEAAEKEAAEIIARLKAKRDAEYSKLTVAEIYKKQRDESLMARRLPIDDSDTLTWSEEYCTFVKTLDFLKRQQKEIDKDGKMSLDELHPLKELILEIITVQKICIANNDLKTWTTLEQVKLKYLHKDAATNNNDTTKLNLSPNDVANAVSHFKKQQKTN